MDGSDQTASASGPLSLSIAAAPELSAARATLRRWLRSTIPDAETDEVLLAGGEALSNALEHGRLPITLHVEWVDSTLTLTVQDSGSWRSPGDPPTSNLTRGLGIPIMTALSDSLTFDTADGTVVTLSRRFTT